MSKPYTHDRRTVSRARRALLVAGALAMLSPDASRADEVVMKDGSKVQGQLVTAVLQERGGGVRQLTRNDFLVLTTTTSGTGGAAPGRTLPSGTARVEPLPPSGTAPSGWGSRPGAPPAPAPGMAGPAGPPPGPGAHPAIAVEPPALVIEMDYEDMSDHPYLEPQGYEKDPGDYGEVFAFRDFQRQDRSSWVRLGSIRRALHEKLPTLDDATELAMVRQLLRDEGETRLSILEKVEDARRYHHRMHYHFEEPVTLKHGTWTVYVDMPRLRRHKIWHGVVFPHDEPVVLEYAWSNHSTFGR